MKRVIKFLVLSIIIAFFGTPIVFAHPGKTDSSGCHTCRTNCAKWGLSTGQYHCHNGGSSSSGNRNYNTTPKRTTTVKQVYGCMDKSAINYNYSANVSDGSCQYEKIEILKENIYYSTEAKGSLTSGEKQVIREGKNGEKEVTIKKIVNENGTEVSSEKINEAVIVEPVNEIVEYHARTTKSQTPAKTEESNTPLVVTIVLLIVNIYYGYKNKDANLLINKIKSIDSKAKYILYFLYFIFIIPVFIDIVLVIIDLLKKNKQN